MSEDKFREFQTDRLVLRKITDEDAEMLFNNIYNNFDWYKYYYQLPFNSFEEYQQLVAKYKDWYARGNHFRWGIVEKESNEMIGLVQLHSRDALNNSCKIGYIVGYNFNKKGYAKEAAQVVLDFGINELDYHRIEAEIVDINKDSIKLAESLGMNYESTRQDGYKLEDEYYDQDVYVLVKKR